MRRTCAALGICLPVAMAACLLAHQAGYMLESPGDAARSLNMSTDGHAYLREFVFLIPAAATIVVVGFLLSLRSAIVATAPFTPSSKQFSLAPALVFLVQEAAERVAAGAPLSLLTELSVLSGLLLQVPFGLVAYLLARLILRAADHVAQAIHCEIRQSRRARADVPLSPERETDAVRVVRLLLDRAPRRGPPCGRSPVFAT